MEFVLKYTQRGMEHSPSHSDIDITIQIYKEDIMADITTQLQKIKNNYHKNTLKITIDMAWPAIV